MAEAKKPVELDSVNRAWVRVCIDNQIKMLMRARTKELVGGEVYVIRTKEIALLTALKELF